MNRTAHWTPSSPHCSPSSASTSPSTPRRSRSGSATARGSAASRSLRSPPASPPRWSRVVGLGSARRLAGVRRGAGQRRRRRRHRAPARRRRRSREAARRTRGSMPTSATTPTDGRQLPSATPDGEPAARRPGPGRAHHARRRRRTEPLEAGGEPASGAGPSRGPGHDESVPSTRRRPPSPMTAGLGAAHPCRLRAPRPARRHRHRREVRCRSATPADRPGSSCGLVDALSSNRVIWRYGRRLQPGVERVPRGPGRRSDQLGAGAHQRVGGGARRRRPRRRRAAAEPPGGRPRPRRSSRPGPGWTARGWRGPRRGSSRARHRRRRGRARPAGPARRGRRRRRRRSPRPRRRAGAG